MAIKIPKAPGVSGKNAETRGVGHGKASRVAGSKKRIAGVRKKARPAKGVSK